MKVAAVSRSAWRSGMSMIVIATALAAAGSASAQTTDQAAPAPDAAPDIQADSSEIVVTGFRSSLAKALDIKRTETVRPIRSWRRTSASSPISTCPNRSSASPAWALSRDGGEGALDLGPRARPAVHPRAHRRDGSDRHCRRVGSFGRHQSRSRLRFQRLRLGPVQWHHRPQDRPGQRRGRLARRDGRPAHRAAVRLQGLHPFGFGPGQLQRPCADRPRRARRS